MVEVILLQLKCVSKSRFQNENKENQTNDNSCIKLSEYSI